MKHRRGIDLVRTGAGYTVGEGSISGGGSDSEHLYRVEVWTDMPESGGELLETISRSTEFAVSCAAFNASIRQRPGKILVHLNGRHTMSRERAPDPPIPEFRRPLQAWGRPLMKHWTGCQNGMSFLAPACRADGAAMWRDATSSE
jgi:hypothetical protein